MIIIESRLRLAAAFLVLLLVAVALLPRTAQSAGTTITEYGGLTGGSQPFGITSGPDGALWFTESAGNRIGRIDPTSHAVTEYAIPTGGSLPEDITTGPDGALWFTEWDGNQIGRIDPTTHLVTEYGGLTPLSKPHGITTGPDGALWFTEYDGNQIGRMTTGGVLLTEWAGLTGGSSPWGITTGPDGALWFTEYIGNQIGRITTGGFLTEYPVPTGASWPNWITTGPDGALWFTELFGNKIGRITTGGAITEYAVPTGGSGPLGIATGPDGALWFCERDGNKIGRIDPTSHAVTEYAIPTGGSLPEDITTGPDGALWFTEQAGNKIGRVSIPFTVNASVSGGHGTVSPATQTVNSAETATINITPDNGYATASITDNSAAKTVANPYVISRVIADHNVVVTFRQSSITPATSPTWYLAEGSTAWGYSTYITIENPNSSGVNAQITYNTKSGNKSGGTVYLPARSQATVNPTPKVTNQDFSTRVTCKEGKTIAVDRTMHWTGSGAASPEGHSSVGVTAPAKTWYLPEGSSDWGFECWTLVQNPNSKNTNVRLTYMIEEAAPRTVSHPLKANSRDSFSMEADLGGKYDASIKVESDIPVIPERSMYRNSRREGHDSIGTTTPAKDYYLAEGSTDWGFTTYVLIQNPNSSAASVTLTYMTKSGVKTQNIPSIPANSRKTVNVGKEVPGMANTDFSTKVHADKPIIAERAMYWNGGPDSSEACHDSIGMSSPHTSFYLPDGETTSGCETWTLVMNPNASDVKVEITYLTKTGKGNVTRTETIAKNSRKTFNMLNHSNINGRAAIMVTSKTSGKKIMAERSMYWNNKGAGTDTIGGYSD